MQKHGGRDRERRAAIEQHLRHGGFAVERRLVQRREAGRVGRLDVGAKFEQCLERRRLFLHDRQVQRTPAVIGSIHGLVHIARGLRRHARG